MPSMDSTSSLPMYWLPPCPSHAVDSTNPPSASQPTPSPLYADEPFPGLGYKDQITLILEIHYYSMKTYGVGLKIERVRNATGFFRVLPIGGNSGNETSG
ncbi:hypothetical protein CC1G_15439 [Coprinopsis cinerea okayama7|jgi:hypothetical protein|uniref:Uncharacterized protein n=1 Tax=Coprinopsis cinerea (strain Okayama-7 / 130 / ATCC MYA-4618 / FGSC 9003) TaxID=240176 RepID=D6RQP2_COPC7|nr:hypothetical protein CC1G_15439 [Coprinopsis cinerea okayama7\|eukprot:XP_002910162.1 hypothetical protein CC1G_15439 [Coprinopsis cinerea okayama7\